MLSFPREKLPKNPKILIIKLRSIGDVVYNTAVYTPLKKSFPGCHLTVLVEHFSLDIVRNHPDIDRVLATLSDIGADGLDCQANGGLSGEFADRLRDAGHEFHVWTVNDRATAQRFMGLGVLSLTTDRPGWLRQQLSKP